MTEKSVQDGDRDQRKNVLLHQLLRRPWFTIARRVGNAVTTHYGWVIVFVTFFLTGLAGGGVALVAVLLKPLVNEFGWHRGSHFGSSVIVEALP